VLIADGRVPRPSPDFAIQTVGGPPIQLKQYRGKVVALVFILTTCPHCQHTISVLAKIQNDYGPRGFQALASAVEQEASAHVPDFIAHFHPSFPVGFNELDAAFEYLRHPRMLRTLMPQLVFIDSKGVVRAQYRGEDAFFSGDQEKNIRQQVEKLLPRH